MPTRWTAWRAVGLHDPHPAGLGHDLVRDADRGAASARRAAGPRWGRARAQPRASRPPRPGAAGYDECRERDGASEPATRASESRSASRRRTAAVEDATSHRGWDRPIGSARGGRPGIVPRLDAILPDRSDIDPGPDADAGRGADDPAGGHPARGEAHPWRPARPPRTVPARRPPTSLAHHERAASRVPSRRPRSRGPRRDPATSRPPRHHRAFPTVRHGRAAAAAAARAHSRGGEPPAGPRQDEAQQRPRGSCRRRSTSTSARTCATSPRSASRAVRGAHRAVADHRRGQRLRHLLAGLDPSRSGPERFADSRAFITPPATRIGSTFGPWLAPSFGAASHAPPGAAPAAPR